jgi:hypothetical protein
MLIRCAQQLEPKSCGNNLFGMSGQHHCVATDVMEKALADLGWWEPLKKWAEDMGLENFRVANAQLYNLGIGMSESMLKSC